MTHSIVSVILLKYDFKIKELGLPGGYSLVAVHGLLTAAASLIAEHGLQGTGSMAAALELSCSAAREILPDQGSNLCLLHWQADSLRVSHQGGPIPLF